MSTICIFPPLGMYISAECWPLFILTYADDIYWAYKVIYLGHVISKDAG